MERNGPILVVEDEEDIRNLIVGRLEREGFQVKGIADGVEAIQWAPVLDPALVVLDLMLPGAPGAAVCRALRGHPTTRNVPILLLTARSDEADRVAGFEIGADDYLSKPFSMRELVLRIRSLLRRSVPPDSPKGHSNFGVFEIDYRQHRVWVENAEIRLSPAEFQILAALTRSGPTVLAEDQLLREAGGARSGLDARTLQESITRLRAKLGPLGPRLETVPGGGYRFTPNADSAAS